MAGNALAVVQTRDIIVYEAPYDETNELPNDNVDWGEPWGAPYTDLGYTDGGVEFRAGLEFADVTVDQELDPLYQVPTGRDLGFSTSLAEVTPANLELATGMGDVSTVAASANTRGHSDLVIGSTIEQVFRTLALDVRNPGDGQAIRLALWKTSPVGTQALPFNPTSKAVIALDVRAYPDTLVVPARIATFRDVSATLGGS